MCPAFSCCVRGEMGHNTVANGVPHRLLDMNKVRINDGDRDELCDVPGVLPVHWCHHCVNDEVI